MPMSVRLDPETEVLIRRMARNAGRSKSWVVREAVAAYASEPARPRTPYEALEPFIGSGGTGLTSLSERTGERFAEMVRVKEEPDRQKPRKPTAKRDQRARRPR
jgi:Ribbon-helix-helix protein, copG family